MSEETSNILPAIPTGEEIEAQQQLALWEEAKQYLLDIRESCPEPYYMLEYNGVQFSTIGGIQALSGQKKNGKTFVLTQLMAAILGGGDRTEAYLPGLKVPARTKEWLGHEPTVLYVDTEMEKLNSLMVARRVHWLCNWDMDVPNKRFNILRLRSVTDVKDVDERVIEMAYKKRYRIIKTTIERLHPDAVFIDGIRDIIGDFNDNAESARLVSDLMAMAEQQNICIWNTLHMNPRPGNENESKMRGHLGTELGNKITDTLVSIKKKDSTGVTFTVKQEDARGQDIEDWRFEVSKVAGKLGIPKIMGAPQIVGEQSIQYTEADKAFSQYRWTPSGATYTDLEKFLRQKGITSSRKISNLFNNAKEAEIIYKDGKNKYHYKGMNKDMPNDRSEDLPFDKQNNNDVPF